MKYQCFCFIHAILLFTLKEKDYEDQKSIPYLLIEFQKKH